MTRVSRGPVAALLAFIVPLMLLRGLQPARAQGDPCRGKDVGTVYLYGQRLSLPYRFEGIGTDTLLLNGLPYLPARMPDDLRARLDVPHDSTMARALRLMDLRSRLNAQVDSLLRAKKSPSLTERLDAMERVFRASPEIEYVRRYDNQLDYKVRGIPEQQGFLFLDQRAVVPANVDKTASHDKAMALFWSDVCGGKLLAVGRGYHEVVPAARRAGLDEVLQRIAGGVEATEDERTQWPLLANAHFICALRDARTREPSR